MADHLPVGAGQPQLLIIPGLLPDLNTYIYMERANRMAAAKLKRKVEEAVIGYIRKSRIKPVQHYPVALHYYWFCKNRRKDKRNVAFAAKFIEDALQRAGILRNDGWNDLCDPVDHFRLDPDHPRIEVVFHEDACQGDV